MALDEDSFNAAIKVEGTLVAPFRFSVTVVIFRVSEIIISVALFAMPWIRLSRNVIELLTSSVTSRLGLCIITTSISRFLLRPFALFARIISICIKGERAAKALASALSKACSDASWAYS